MSVDPDPLASAGLRPAPAWEALPERGHPDGALTEGLRPLVLQLARHLRRAAQKAGVSSVDAQFLAIVARRPGVGVSELAEIEQMSRPAMSAHVKRLQGLGLIAHAPEPEITDRRRVRLVLTEAGLDALAAVRRSRNDWLSERLAALDDPDRAALGAAVEPLARLLAARPLSK